MEALAAITKVASHQGKVDCGKKRSAEANARNNEMSRRFGVIVAAASTLMATNMTTTSEHDDDDFYYLSRH